MSQEYKVEIILKVSESIHKLFGYVVADLYLNSRYVNRLAYSEFYKDSKQSFNVSKLEVLNWLDAKNLQHTEDHTLQWFDEWYNNF